MVSQAIDEGLLRTIQSFVANDINRRIKSYVSNEELDDIGLDGDDRRFEICVEDVYILSFERVLNNWSVTATASRPLPVSSFYKIVHDGSTDTTLVHLYIEHSTYPAVL